MIALSQIVDKIQYGDVTLLLNQLKSLTGFMRTIFKDSKRETNELQWKVCKLYKTKLEIYNSLLSFLINLALLKFFNN